VLVGLSSSALTLNLSPLSEAKIAPRGTTVLKKSGGSRLGVDLSSGVPS
jgi:hypothetical protein